MAFEDFGDAVNPLQRLPHDVFPGPVTSSAGLLELLDDLEERIKHVQRRCFAISGSLREYNHGNAVDAEPCWFVIVPQTVPISDRDAFTRFNGLMTSEAARRAGIFFLLADSVKPQSALGKVGHLIELHTDTSQLTFTLQGPHPLVMGEFEAFADVAPPDVVGRALQSWATTRAQQNSRVLAPAVSLMEGFRSSAIDGLTIPIGIRSGKTLSLIIAAGTPNHHVMVGGGVGSGKTVLLHNIVLGGALHYSPEELHFVLLDYKEGTEFTPYESLPHTRVLSVASETEFGLRVFEWLEEQIEVRGKAFRKELVSNYSDYRRRSGAKLPRLLVIVDEFQRLLSDSRVAARFETLLDDIIRRGRSFGIHVILSTQSLQGIAISEATRTNASIRICLRIAERDAGGILAWDNLAPALFTQSGLAVYNDNNGALGHNKDFAVYWRDITEIQSLVAAIARSCAPPKEQIIYSGEDFAAIDPKAVDNVIQASSELVFIPGVRPAVRFVPQILRFSISQPETTLIIGSNQRKLSALLATMVFQCRLQFRKLSRCTILNPGAVALTSLLSAPLDNTLVDVIDGEYACDVFLQNISNSGSSSDHHLPQVVFVLDASALKSLRKTVVDPETGIPSLSPPRAALSELLLHSETKRTIMFLHVRSGPQFDAVFGAYDLDGIPVTPVRSQSFDYMLLLDAAAAQWKGIDGVRPTSHSIVMIDSGESSSVLVQLINSPGVQHSHEI